MGIELSQTIRELTDTEVSQITDLFFNTMGDSIISYFSAFTVAVNTIKEKLNRSNADAIAFLIVLLNQKYGPQINASLLFAAWQRFVHIKAISADEARCITALIISSFGS